MNTTVGIGGLIDVATYEGVKRENEDFGQTLAFYGLGPGPYLILPVLGPYNLRDAAGWGVDLVAYNLVMNELFQELAIKGKDKDRLNWGLLALYAIDKRHQYSFRYFMTGSPFEYEFVRKVYQVYREFLIES
jgi:phospholipid-binding lipoprotein MlaA